MSGVLTHALRFSLVLGAWAATAEADRPRARLHWQRPIASMCPSAETLEADTELLLGQEIFSAAENSEIVVEGAIDELPAGVYARVSARRGDTLLGARELAAPPGNCAALRRPIVLVLALLLDAHALEEARARAVWDAELGAAGLSGLLPRLGPAGEVGVGLELAGRWWLRASARYVAPVAAETPEGAGARFQALAGVLALCPRLTPRGAFVLRGCAALVLGALFARPRELDGPARVTRLLSQAEVLLSGALRVRRSSWLEAAAGPSIALARPEFALERRAGDELVVHRPASVGAFFRLTLIIGGG